MLSQFCIYGLTQDHGVVLLLFSWISTAVVLLINAADCWKDTKISAHFYINTLPMVLTK